MAEITGTFRQPDIATYQQAVSRAESSGKSEIHGDSQGRLKVGGRNLAVRFINSLSVLFGGRDRVQQRNASEIQRFQETVNQRYHARGATAFREARESLSQREVKVLSPSLIRQTLAKIHGGDNKHALNAALRLSGSEFRVLFRMTPAFKGHAGAVAEPVHQQRLQETAARLSRIVSDGNLKRLSDAEIKGVALAAFKTLPGNHAMNLWNYPESAALRGHKNAINAALADATPHRR